MIWSRISLFCLCWVALVALAEAPRPNFIVFFADDLGYGDLQAYGHPAIRTPNIDALARTGQRWTDFYVAAPVCSPSRGALLTGRLPPRTGLYGERIAVYFPNDPGGFPANETTLAEALQAVGYRTGIVGKWHLGDAPHAWPTRHGFDEWLGLPYSNDMNWVGGATIDTFIALNQQGKTAEIQSILARRASRYSEPKAEYWHVPLLHSVRTGSDYRDQRVSQAVDQANLTKQYTQKAVDFIASSGEQPFFLYLPYTMPHTPLFRSEAFAGHSLGGRYGDVIEELDWSVGQVMDAVAKAGFADNTLVLFTSDNGPWLTMGVEGGQAGGLRSGKGTTFEGGMRVPAVFSWPGRLAPGVVRQLGSTLDVFPTFAALAGANKETATDGRDLSATLLRRVSSTRRELPFYRGGELYAYRHGPWKLHLITQGAYGQGGQKTEHEQPLLYHLGRDPGERFDVAAQNPEVVKRTLQAIETHRATMTRRPPEFDRRLAVLTSDH